MAHSPAILPVLLAASLAAAPAGAEGIVARYEVSAAGMTVLAIDARFDMAPQGYRLRLAAETRGVAALLGRSHQVTLSEGGWRDSQAVPLRYQVDGFWRGVLRQVALDYPQPGQPRVLTLQPALEADREAVPDALRQGTMDGLSALAMLSRTIARTGRCEAEAAVYDGRRRVDYAARTASMDSLPPGAGWSGPALRCAFEGRVQAGFRLDEDRAQAARPQTGHAWMAAVLPGRMPLPVRVEMASRWFGTVRVQLVRVAATEGSE
jgi:hypothetical protein